MPHHKKKFENHSPEDSADHFRIDELYDCATLPPLEPNYPTRKGSVHVLDEISSLEEAMYENTRRDSRRPTRGAKGKRRHVTEEESEDESGESEEAEMTDNEGRNKKSAATAAFTTTPPRRGIDFSNCF